MCIYIVQLYLKRAGYFMRKMNLFRIVEELQFGTRKCVKPQANPKNRGKALGFIVEEEDVVRDCFEEFRTVMAVHWLSVAVSHCLFVIRSPNLKATS